ncbi:hypothetical protein [Bifidobacterium crudilactis]|jgi:hypothetical protein|uniref:hypothetical protein n=1 Tax=Bifidobacterium crudilactis TaxID=327277 RepID=UPI002F3579F0
MGIVVTRPTKQFEIVTDLQALHESLAAAREIEGKDNVSKTERADLKRLLQKVDESTIVLTLRGLNSSEWNMIVIKNTEVVKDRLVKDVQQLVLESVPGMLESAEWKSTSEPIVFEGDEIASLIGSMSDSQTGELMVTVQELNSPNTSVPKDLADLI